MNNLDLLRHFFEVQILPFFICIYIILLLCSWNPNECKIYAANTAIQS